MVNLLHETLEIMKQNDCNPEYDVLWVGSKDGKYGMSWNEFKKIADFNYSNSYGSIEIPIDLVVVFLDGGWLERHEYDGSEWWEYKITPQQQQEPKKFTKAKSSWSGWDDDLEEANEDPQG